MKTRFSDTNALASSLDKLYYHSSGQAHAAANVTWANTGQAVRSWLTGTQLGGATLSAFSDWAFLRSTAAFNGLSSTRVMARYVQALGELSTADGRRAATQQGLMVETGLRGIARHFDETLNANLGKPGTSSPRRAEAARPASAACGRPRVSCASPAWSITPTRAAWRWATSF
jgi:hypothetical protein